MPREVVLLRARLFVGRRNRKLSPAAQWLYQHLHFQPDLTMIGTLALNARKWAGDAEGLTVEETDRLLDRIEAAGLILMESCTQEAFLTEFMDNGHEIRHPNHVKHAVSAWNRIESERLRDAAYQAVPAVVKAAIDAAIDRACEGAAQGLPRGSAGADETIAKTATATATEPVDTSVVLRRLQQEMPLPGFDNDEPDSVEERSRVEDAITVLAQRRVAESPLSWDLERALADQWAQHGALLVRLAHDYPGWMARHLADAIDQGTFSER